MIQAPREHKILKDAQRNNLPVPKSILNAPELMQGLELFYSGFQHLINSRSEYGISWQVVNDYCKSNNLYDDQTEEMHYFIKEMDSEYMKISKDQSE